MQQAAQDARLAAQKLATFTEGDKNAALRRIQGALSARIPEIRRANATDVANMTDDNAPLKKRLVLDDAKIDSLIRGIDQVIALPDPVGKVDYANELQEGLELFRVSCPIGVLGIIFEARPEAAVQITCLSIKSGNAVLLKGGKEARESNRVLVQIMTEAIMGRPEQNLNWPTGVVQNLDSRDEVNAMLKMDKYIDLIIPRGSNQLVSYIKQNTLIPVLGHADGICAIYVDKDADVMKAANIVYESKTNYPAGCNAVETMLIHASVLEQPDFVPQMIDSFAATTTEFRCCGRSKKLFAAAISAAQSVRDQLTNGAGDSAKAAPARASHLSCVAAREEDFSEEFLGLTMAVKVVDSLEEAVTHINAHGSHHTDCVITENEERADAFCQRVDSSSVFHNMSTRYADGFRFGFGAEIGISTNRVHARGPVGLEGLVIYKYRGHSRSSRGHCLVGPAGGRPWKHADIAKVSSMADIQKRRGVSPGAVSKIAREEEKEGEKRVLARARPSSRGSSQRAPPGLA